MKALDRLLNKYSDLVNLLNGNTIDPARVRAADEEVRYSVFFKIDSYVKLLKSMEKVKLESYVNIPKETIHNMNEIATETSKHHQKTLHRKLP